MFFKAFKQIVQIHLILGDKLIISVASVLDQTLRQVFFESLQRHDLFLDCIFDDKSVDIDGPCLADTMGPIHSL